MSIKNAKFKSSKEHLKVQKEHSEVQKGVRKFKKNVLKLEHSKNTFGCSKDNLKILNIA